MRIFLIITVVLSLVPFAVAADRMERPTLQAGDEWDVAVTVISHSPQGNITGGYVAKRIVVGPESVVTSNGTRTLLKIVEVNHETPNGVDPASFAGKTLDFPGVTDVVWMDADGKVWKELRPAPRGQTTMEWPGGCDLDGYPYHEGAQNGVNCRFAQDGAADQQSGAFTRVTGYEDVTVPAGRFSAFVVHHAPEGQDTEAQWYVPEVCWRVRTSTSDGGVQMRLLGFKCGASSGGVLFTAQPALDLAGIGHPSLKPAPGLGPIGLAGALAIGAILARRSKRS